MVSIIQTTFIEFSNGKSVERVDLCVDTASELPEVDGISGRVLYQGSIAWDISTGDFYGLNSDGTWYKQDGTGAYDPEAEVSLNAAPSQSVGNLNRPAVQPIQLVQPSFIDSEGDTDDSEDEEPTEKEPYVIEDEPEETEEEPEEETEVIEDAEPLRNLEDI